MKAVVLISKGRHPVSGRAVLLRLEAQAIALARTLDPQCRGVHAGPDVEGVSDALGHGLDGLDFLVIGEAADPVPALASYLLKNPPDVIFAGRRGQGGEDTGLFPYLLSDALSLPLLNDVVSASPSANPGTARFDQTLTKGAKRQVTLRLPAIITVHPNAPAALPFAYAKAIRGSVDRHEGLSVAKSPSNLEERPHRFRPKLMRQAGSGVTSGEGVILDPDPDDAARMIIDHLEKLGVREFGSQQLRSEDVGRPEV
ncbi:electron transfer flavoprotein subunit beta [Notoacmeibacter sp. MSK16QG-6]|uniref:electron transfer flavoprotein subunit beta n=1 Tax=Notoacmeibacter sp. MSK16QG-6 TaxID=2957982 RepID=UPI0020A150F3|nr:electron transfer flavoprotein subunit beta [Notoacmeibacter sp. MSK16QG-6]MCP1200782.1 electron transfer flavoprotein subunit beta [Notoacmeibacter sp. MSK16QG-6]